MSFIEEKWFNSTIFTKLATFSMALAAVLLLICSILFFALSGTGGEDVVALGVTWLIMAAINALITFGLLKLSRIARISAIYLGLCILIPYVLLAALWIFSLIRIPLLGTLVTAYFELLRAVWPMMRAFVPAEAAALFAFLMIVFVGPMILNVFAMLILFIFGKDFAGDGGRKSKAVAYLLWFFLGYLSAHKFYLGKDRIGIVYFLTFQIVTLGWWANLFTLGKQVDAYNAKLDEAV